MRTYNIRSAALRTVLGALFFGAIMAAAADASAQVALNNPFGGAAATAYIAHDLNSNGEWILWARRSDGACSNQLLGYGGLNNDYYVQAGPNSDHITILTGSTPFSWCTGNLVGLNYGGHHIDLLGGAGNDWLYSGTGDTWQYGYGGMDLLHSYGGLSRHMVGGDGNDSVLTDGYTNYGTFESDGGDDCLLLYTSSTNPTVMSCGAGNDKWRGPGTRPADCEQTISGSGANICPWIVG